MIVEGELLMVGLELVLTALAKLILPEACLRSFCLACALDKRTLVWNFSASVSSLNTRQFREKAGWSPLQWWH